MTLTNSINSGAADRATRSINYLHIIIKIDYENNDIM